jgi:hypothetical protein
MDSCNEWLKAVPAYRNCDEILQTCRFRVPLKKATPRNPASPGNDHGHGQSMTAWLRSRRAGNGGEVNGLEIGFADRHHLLTVVEVNAGPQNRSGKRRQRTCRFLSPLVSGSCRSLPPFAADRSTPFNTAKRFSTPFHI